VIQQNASQAEELSSTAEELSSQAEQLDASISFFQVDGRGNAGSASGPATTEGASPGGQQSQHQLAQPNHAGKGNSSQEAIAQHGSSQQSAPSSTETGITVPEKQDQAGKTSQQDLDDAFEEY
jgi:methyl-accepting chemotaxis protein